MFIAILKYKPPFSFSLVPQLTITNADALVDEFFSMNSLQKYTCIEQYSLFHIDALIIGL